MDSNFNTWVNSVSERIKLLTNGKTFIYFPGTPVASLLSQWYESGKTVDVAANEYIFLHDSQK